MTVKWAPHRVQLLAVQARTRAQAPLERPGGTHWDQTAITFQHQLKACRITGACVDLLERLGYPRRAAVHLMPVILHFVALVYRADCELEEYQLGGAIPKHSGREGIDAILEAYGLSDDKAIEAELDALVQYAQTETGIMRGHRTVTAEIIHETCYSRSAHIRLLLRFALRLAGLPVDEEFMGLAQHVFARDEVIADCVSYDKDVADDSFNTLRLQAQVHGSKKAADAQRRLVERILRDLHADITHASRPALMRFSNAFLPRPAITGARRYGPSSRIPLIRRLTPLPLLRRQARRQTTRTPRLTPVAVPTPRAETVTRA